MNTLAAFFAASIVSVVAIFYLRTSDPKRLRVHSGVRDAQRRSWRTGIAWLIVFLPGAALLSVSQYTAFLSWIGAMTVIGWLLALRPS